MDMNEEFKKEQPKPKGRPRKDPRTAETDPAIFSLNCSVTKKENGNYLFKGNLEQTEMDTELLSTILKKIVTSATPESEIENVMNRTAEKLGLIDADEYEEDIKTKLDNFGKTIIDNDKMKVTAIDLSKEGKDFLNFMKKLLGE